MASFSILNVIVLVSFLTTIANAQPLSENFYRRTCPKLDLSFLDVIVADNVAGEPRLGASLLRLHFHDCFVNGCDASVLLGVPGREKDSVRNAGSLRGFDVIDSMKKVVEEACPGVVSCADLLAFAARVSVVTLGGPSWTVLFGRKDSRTSASAQSTTAQLPSANANLGNLVTLFASKGFSRREMIALSGAHTIGQARCRLFRNRIYNEPNIALSSLIGLQEICPRTPGDGDDNLAPLDFFTQNEFNNDYFEGLLDGHGVLHSDQVLFAGNGSSTDNIVQLYADDEQRFFTDFSKAMLKMSRLGVKTGRNGMIRTNCRSAS